MDSRQPVVAGQFYPARPQACEQSVVACLDEAKIEVELPQTIAAGIVPHAGWMFSGPLAAMVFAAVKQRHDKVDTFVIFGAAHGYFGNKPAVYSSGVWHTPLGRIAIDEELSEAIMRGGKAVGDGAAHGGEHSIEVQVPFIQHLFPEARIVPVVVPPGDYAIALGEMVGDEILESDKTIVCIGSTDLTHYGPRYGFAPMGLGEEGLKWASEVNDAEFIDKAVALDAQGLLSSAAEHCNACGPGAAAATIAAAKKQGKTKGTLLAHTNSNQIMQQKMDATSSEAVGYAAIVI